MYKTKETNLALSMHFFFFLVSSLSLLVFKSNSIISHCFRPCLMRPQTQPGICGLAWRLPSRTVLQPHICTPGLLELSHHDFVLSLSFLFLILLGVPFPKNFLQICKKILCRLFRVFVHVYIHHFDRVIVMGAEAHVNTCYKHFYYFVTEMNLIDRKELEPLVSVPRHCHEAAPRSSAIGPSTLPDPRKGLTRGGLLAGGLQH